MTELVEANSLVTEEDTLRGKFLTFNLEKEVYGIAIQYVVEIIGMQPITLVPELPPYVRGIINLRGKIVPVMDVRIRFSKEVRAYDDRTCVIVIDIKDMSIGLIVDQVAEVQAIPEEEIVPPPELAVSRDRFIQGVAKVGDQVKLILDCERLLNMDDLEELGSIK